MKNKEKNHYQILGIKKSATIGEIKVAYRKRIAKTHPDKNTDSDHDNEAWRINLAYHTLKDPKRRAEYDRRLLAQTLLTGTPLEKFAQNLDNVRFDRQAFEHAFGQAFEQAFGQTAHQFANNLSHNANLIRQKMRDNLKTFNKKLATTSDDKPLILQVFAWQAMLGDEIIFVANQQQLKIKLPPNTQNGTILQIHNLAKPLTLKIAIINPDSTNTAQQQAWENLKNSYKNQ